MSNVFETSKRSISHVIKNNERIDQKMRFVAVILMVIKIKFAIASFDEKEHVHFKIYVPEIIKHHIHTKTIFIHVHEPMKKVTPKKNSHLETHYEDWIDYSNYDNANEHGELKNNERSAIRAYQGHHITHGGHYAHGNRYQGHVTPQEMTAPKFLPLRNDDSYPHYHRENLETPIPHYDDYQDNYGSRDYDRDEHPVPLKSVFRNGVVGYSYPPQYEVHENVVEDTPANSHEKYENSHVQGHRERQQTETGHLYTNELKNFYDDKHEESSETLSMESKEIDENKDSDSYRYVGDEDYITTRMTIR